VKSAKEEGKKFYSKRRLTGKEVHRNRKGGKKQENLEKLLFVYLNGLLLFLCIAIQLIWN
jgi:hypothetical protein